MVVAVVGAGGKTGLIKKYASEYREQGLKVFVTTSTHMMVEEDTIVLDDKSEIKFVREVVNKLEDMGYVMAGMYCDEQGKTLAGEVRGKIQALPADIYEEICKHADVVLVEADGSKHMPIKFPREDEPVIYDNVDEIHVICGLHALGKTFANAAHRLELVKAGLGVNDHDIVRPEHIQKLVVKGYVEPLREKYPDKKVVVKPNLASSLYEKAVARLLEEEKDVTLIKEEWFLSQPELVICGAGHVAYELSKMAACLDFRIKVMDDREEFANRERFPEADELICDSFENLEQHMGANAYYVVLTRGHSYDFDCVNEILKRPYQYLGMIGSRRKVKATFEKLAESGYSEEQIQTIHAPIGLDIKAQTPAEIAVSILAEIIMEKNQKDTSYISRELQNVDEKGVLCIITKKQGSSPRGVGSMMFVTEEGIIDTIGGGAVENAVIQEAREIREVTVREYLLNNSESANLGMICGGSNEVLFIPI